MIDTIFIQRKLELIAEELGRLLEFKTWSYDEIVGDFIKLAAVERILERIVNRAVDVNQHIIAHASTGNDKKITRLTYRETFLKLADLEVYPSNFAEQIARSDIILSKLSRGTAPTSVRIRFKRCVRIKSPSQLYGLTDENETYAFGGRGSRPEGQTVCRGTGHVRLIAG